jgi:outer membrane protein assembly factor BamA
VLLGTSAAQKKPAPPKPPSVAPTKLIAVKLTGSTRYTDKEVLAASGLWIGQDAADGDFKEAAQRLGNSGMFSDVAYSYSSSGAGTKLELQVSDTDSSKLVPAQFENFVWFTDSELLSLLGLRIPLFKRLLPLTGTLPDQLAETLQAILSEKHAPGRVSFLRNADQASGTLFAINYQVDEVSIQIRNIDFPGASPEQTVLLTTAAHRLVGATYRRDTLAAVAKFDLLPIYLQRGYLKAEFSQSDARLVPKPASEGVSQASSSNEIEVDAVLPVSPGKVYSTSGVTLKGNSAIATNELVPLLHLMLGRPADAVRLLHDIETVSKLYRSRGYMVVQVKPDAQFDDERDTVHYDLNIAEGALYKMGEVEITGLDTQSTARMRNAWTLRQGDPYNADYPKQFLADTGQLLPKGVRWAINIHETPDAKDRTVDVEIHFQQQ